jgi:hypothetical protein
MTTTYPRLMLWTPRLLGIAFSLFLGLFALDAFAPGQPLGQALIAFAIHLVPSALVLAIVALSWRWEWIGGVGFVALAVAYALMVRFRLQWVMAISGPLLVLGVLFLWSWRNHHDVHTA